MMATAEIRHIDLIESPAKTVVNRVGEGWGSVMSPFQAEGVFCSDGDAIFGANTFAPSARLIQLAR